MSGVDPDMLAQMRAHFGEEETEEYLTLMKAVRYYIHSWGYFTQTEDGSAEETAARAELERMAQDIVAHPQHAVGLIEALAAITVHMIQGGSIEEWFKESGLEWTPEKADG